MSVARFARALLVSACLAIGLAVPALASAATYEVDSTGDGASQAICEAGTAGCTLRGAILAANATDATPDAIAFSAAFNGELADTIEVAAPLPPIHSPVAIDGKTCVTPVGVTGPCVGVNAVAGAAWIFDVEEEDTTIDNLAITGGVSAIVVIESSTSFSAAGNWIGVKLNGTAAGASQWGIEIGQGSDGATIGGVEPGEGNVIANNGTGLVIYGAAGTVVQGNWFGVGPDGTAAAGAAGVNIEVRDLGDAKATGTEIGATISGSALTSMACDGGCNVISRASLSGIELNGGATGPTTIHGNYIGLGPNGTNVIPNGSWGVRVGGSGDVTVGGPGGEQNANFFAGDGVPGSDLAISHGGGEGFEAVGNRIGIGPVLEENTSPPGNGIITTGASGAEPALLAENRIWADGMGIESVGRGAEILDNLIGTVTTGIRTRDATGGAGNLIEGNTIREVLFNGIVLENGPNQVFGNTLEEVTLSAIFLKGAASGNRIGGDTAASENFIRDSEQTAIALVLPGSTQNEVARNRGKENAGAFISLGPESANGGISPPTLTSAFQSSASGTSLPGAKVRVFRKDTDEPGEIASFLGQATADGAGKWTVKYSAQVPVGTNLAATQTNTLGGTSELAFAVASVDPPPPTCNDTPAPAMCVLPPPPPTPDTTKPKVTIKKAPKAKSTATTAKFKFASNEAGSKFKCKLDKKAFANCKSPKTYKKLKPGKHVFKVKATDAAGNVSPVVTRKFTVLE